MGAGGAVVTALGPLLATAVQLMLTGVRELALPGDVLAAVSEYLDTQEGVEFFTRLHLAAVACGDPWKRNACGEAFLRMCSRGGPTGDVARTVVGLIAELEMIDCELAHAVVRLYDDPELQRAGGDTAYQATTGDQLGGGVRWYRIAREILGIDVDHESAKTWPDVADVTMLGCHLLALCNRLVLDSQGLHAGVGMGPTMLSGIRETWFAPTALCRMLASLTEVAVDGRRKERKPVSKGEP
jgi:hypothetical protein